MALDVVDTGTAPTALSWVNPAIAAALYPTELGWQLIKPWNAATPYLKDDLVSHAGMVWRKTRDADQGEPGVEHVQTGTIPFATVFAPTFQATAPNPLWVPDPDVFAQNLRTEIALAQATWLLDVQTQGRLHGVECWQEDYAVHHCEIKLRRGPVVAINKVQIRKQCGRVVDDQAVEDYCRTARNTISFCCKCSFAQFSCGCQDTVVRVDYQIGSNLPPGTEGLVAWLAAQYAKASVGQACGLPERLNTVTRQGVSWTILDPGDYLDKGRTGMPRVDDWAAAALRTLGAGTIIDPLRSDRVWSIQHPCGPRGEFGDQDPTDPRPDPFSKAFKVNS